MTDAQHIYEVEIRVSDASTTHTTHREMVTDASTPEEATRQLLGGLYAGTAQKLKPVTDGA